MKYDIHHIVVSASQFNKESLMKKDQTEGKSETSSRLGKWVLPKPKAYKDDDEVPNTKEVKDGDETVLLKEKKSKINWGERRATLVSSPQEPIELNFSQGVLKCEKFEVQFKNKTKWPWKKGCSLGFLMHEENAAFAYPEILFSDLQIPIKFPVKGDQTFKVTVALPLKPQAEILLAYNKTFTQSKISDISSLLQKLGNQIFGISLSFFGPKGQ